MKPPNVVRRTSHTVGVLGRPALPSGGSESEAVNHLVLLFGIPLGDKTPMSDDVVEASNINSRNPTLPGR
jgi:hypothetical protein